MKTKDWLLLALFAGGAYYLWRSASGVSKALTGAGEAIGSGLYDLFNPDPLGNVVYYTATFPDGRNHAVPANLVNSAGRFVNANLAPNYAGDGKTYQLVVDKSVTSGVNKRAVPV